MPKIIEDTELFAKVQKRLEYNKRYARKNQKHDYLLTGLVWCECGHRRAGDGYSKGGNHYYRCAQRIYKLPEPSECTSPGVNAIVLDKEFWLRFSEFMKSPELSREAAEAYLKETSQDSIAMHQTIRLKQILENLADEEKRYIKAYGTGSMNEEQFQEVIKEVAHRRTAHQNQLSELKKRADQRSINPIAVDELIERVQEKLRRIELSQRREMIHDVVSKVIIGRNDVDIHGKIALSSPSLSLNMGQKNENRNRRLT